jgi:hypothetical protein
VSGQLHAPVTLPPGKSPWYPLGRRLVGPQSRSGCGGEEKNSQPLPGLEPTIIQVVVLRYTTELSRILLPRGRLERKWEGNIMMNHKSWTIFKFIKMFMVSTSPGTCGMVDSESESRASLYAGFYFSFINTSFEVLVSALTSEMYYLSVVKQMPIMT